MPQRHPLDKKRTTEQQGGNPLADQIGDRRTDKLQPRHTEPAVHEQRAQHGRHREPEDDVAQRSRGVLHAAHPSVARSRDQDGGHADDRDPHPRQRCPGDVSARGKRRNHWHSDDLEHDDDQCAQPDGEPGRLHTFTDRRLAVARAEKAGRARRGAVGQERHLRAQRAQDQPTDGKAGKAERAEPTDDGEVEQQVDGFGGQHPERG